MTPSQRKQWRDEYIRLSAEYLAAGNTVTQLPGPGEPRPEDDPANWVTTEQALAIIGVCRQQLSKWKTTNAPHCPKWRRAGKGTEWYRPGLEALSKKYGSKAA